MRTLLALSALGLTALVSACSHSVDTAGAPSFGVSVETMQREQAVRSEASDEAPEGSGAVGALAQERYQSGHTRPLMPTTTSSANPTTN